MIQFIDLSQLHAPLLYDLSKDSKEENNLIDEKSPEKSNLGLPNDQKQ